MTRGDWTWFASWLVMAGAAAINYLQARRWRLRAEKVRKVLEAVVRESAPSGRPPIRPALELADKLLKGGN